MRRLKVAVVSEHASPLAALGGVDAGGQNVHVAELATELGRRGIDIVVHTRLDRPDLPPRVPMAGDVVVDHVAAGPAEHVPKDRLFGYMPRFASELAARWRTERPDLVHAHFWMSGWAAEAAARPLGVPVVHTFHALGVVKRRHQGAKDTSPPEREMVEAELARTADQVIATSSDEVFELAGMGADLGRVAVVPCGVDPVLFRPTGPVEPKHGGQRRLVVVSRLVERKGVGNVITALAELPNTELVIAGGPDKASLAGDAEAQRLMALARSLGVDDRVELRGRVARDSLPALLRSADVVVCVPWYEPFGIVPLEAMACGIPVVVSAVGGLVDTVIDDITGVHVPPRDPEALARVLRRLLADGRRRMALGAAGRRRIEARYSWSRVAEATLQMYDKVLAAAEPARRGGVRA